jgi:exoribonuclease-2
MLNRAFDLAAAAHQEMVDRGFHPDFSPAVLQQLTGLIHRPVSAPEADVRDFRAMFWSSIDNDTSQDLDQIEVAERTPAGIRLFIGIADVDTDVTINSPIDQHAASETTSVYTGIRTFPMLPEELSTDITSLNENVDRLAIVVEMTVTPDGAIASESIYRALVRNKAQLTYNGVGHWLEGRSGAPPKVAASAELAAQLKLQDEAAQILHAERIRLGALSIDRVEAEAVVTDGEVKGLNARQKNRASEIIENLMVAANGVVARTLASAGVSSIRRIVRTPERWERIVNLAARYGYKLPATPDSGALNQFLQERKAADPVQYADVSLAVIKLMGPGEYAVSRPGKHDDQSHFALAAHDYTHSTAPNRRFADTVTQRLIKAVLAASECPYSDRQLDTIAGNCTEREDAARKVERVMGKRIAAVALRPRIGETFAGVITGVTPKGTFVRISNPPAEGILIQGEQGVDVGDQLRVKLVSVDPRHGYIDFTR